MTHDASINLSRLTQPNPGDLFDLWAEDAAGAMHFTTAAKMPDSLAVLRGEAEPGLVEFKAEAGRRAFDLLTTSFFHVLLVSDRFVRVLREHDAKGWSTWPVRLRDGKGRAVDGYAGLVVRGRCGAVDWSRSAGPVASRWGFPFEVRRGLFPDMSEWDGSDIFMARNTAHVIIAGGLMEAMKRVPLSNVRYTSLAELETPAL